MWEKTRVETTSHVSIKVRPPQEGIEYGNKLFDRLSDFV